ncbi:MAG TPA: VWA domain-containing protein [Epulopiscium sp.]|nr:VWA domain-containing protein [Candidatus Epulonipiscium sp.]
MRNTMKNKRLIVFLLSIFLIQQLAFTHPIYGKDPNATNIDAMIVIDVSGSMKASDPNRLAQEAIKLFTDMMSAQGDKIGLVAYSDKVVNERAMVSLDDEKEKEEFKDFVKGLKPGGDTDISLGLKRAVKILDTNKDPQNKPLIIILADGNNDLGKNNSRTEDDVDKDMKEILEQAKKEGYPMYTIGLNADGKLNSDFLEEISAETGGKFFSTKTASDLPDILSEIFADHSQLKITNIAPITGNGDFQEVPINIPNANVKEANISIMSNQDVELELYNPSGGQVGIPSSEVIYSKSNTYGLLKILDPDQGEWVLKVKGIDGDKIKINLIFNYSLGLALDPIPSTVTVGDTIDFKAFFENNQVAIQDPELYKDVVGSILVKDMDTLKEEEIQLVNTGSGFEGNYVVPDAHEYQLTAMAQHPSFLRQSDVYDFKASAKGTSKPQVPKVEKEEKEPKGFSWALVIAGISALILALIGVLGLTYYKKITKPFVGQIVIEQQDDNTGKKTSPVYKKLNTFKGKFTLHQLLQLDPALKETQSISFVPTKNDRILIINNGDNNVEKSGRVIDASKGYELKDGDRITIGLHNVDDTIYLEYLT